MKRVRLFLACFLTFFFLLSLGTNLFAIEWGKIPSPSELGFGERAPVSDVGGLVGILTLILRWTYTIFFIVAVALVLFAAYNYLFAKGDPTKVKDASKQLIWAAVAIAVALIAVGAVAIVRSFLGDAGGVGPGTGGLPTAPGPYETYNF